MRVKSIWKKDRLVTLSRQRSNDRVCGGEGKNVEGVLIETGYAALKVCHQVYYCLETDSMAAIHSDAIFHTDGESALGHWVL